ncbi:uncharacterized protein K452DRAFT_351172 [Aplosporella prunicola CBS 121167]|uniref:Calcineurin-like phosphoesterase domain-containing protein n=1 Tax=Aplosporella prunicola CBS 121167 TaxID=1176127 RepID=A0A6A6BBF8_9PEZI|nr:uncharacterized protein K452DRAFT_351172 [Aplosporella prunicola CBS 121167]KAF2141572.1 hypothetical protein K452DRAFT_351172 [Aplosporella prunicola CBS 121167]
MDLTPILHRCPPTRLELLRKQPTLTLAKALYELHPARAAPAPSNPLTLVLISDTHNHRPALPDGDILIHAGDLTNTGTFAEIQTALDWLNAQSYKHIVLVAGNHDVLLDARKDGTAPAHAHAHDAAEQRAALAWGRVTYLCRSGATLVCGEREVTVWGSPHTPRHGNGAFQYTRTQDIWRDTVPEGLDVLVTHGPPQGHLDCDGFGCALLGQELWRLRHRPKVHVFGHCHAGRGVERAAFDALQGAWERVVAAKGSVWGLVRLLGAFFGGLVFGRREQVLFVNAALVQGLTLRDEVVREAMVVDI